jgi:hypothetical protein
MKKVLNLDNFVRKSTNSYDSDLSDSRLEELKSEADNLTNIDKKNKVTINFDENKEDSSHKLYELRQKKNIPGNVDFGLTNIVNKNILKTNNHEEFLSEMDKSMKSPNVSQNDDYLPSMRSSTRNTMNSPTNDLSFDETIKNEKVYSHSSLNKNPNYIQNKLHKRMSNNKESFDQQHTRKYESLRKQNYEKSHNRNHERSHDQPYDKTDDEIIHDSHYTQENFNDQHFTDDQFELNDMNSSINNQEQEDDNEFNPFNTNHHTPTYSSVGTIPEKPKTHEELQREKQLKLIKLEKYRKKGYDSLKKYSMVSTLDEISMELDRIEEEYNIDQSLKFQRKILMGIVTGTEWLNKMYDPFDLYLDGWSESVYENLGDYDDVFEELYEKYKDQVSVPPELKLIGMVTGSAMMFHFTRASIVGKQDPVHESVLNNDPELKQKYQEAMNKMGTRGKIPKNQSNPFQTMASGLGGAGGLGNIMNMFMGDGGNQTSNLFDSFLNPNTTTNSNNNYQTNNNQNTTSMHDMKPSDDIDEILKSNANRNNINLDGEVELNMSDISNLSEL